MSLASTYANYSPDWWTPPEWMSWVYDTLGDVFDPCPQWWDDVLNPSGLEIDWGDRCYVNHPGARGSTQRWWEKAEEEQPDALIWCAFNVEQLRHLRPSPLEQPGWLVMPRRRIGFVWGGPTNGKRVHGEVAKSPGNWTVFWTTAQPATPPVESLVLRTGAAWTMGVSDE